MFKKKDRKSPKGDRSSKDKKNKTPNPPTTSSDPPHTPATPSSSSQPEKVVKMPPPIPSPSDFPSSRNPSGSNTPKRGDETPATPSPWPSMPPTNSSEPTMPSESSELRRKRLRKPSFLSFGRGTTSSERDASNVVTSPSLGSPPSKDMTTLGRSTPGGLMSPSTTYLTDPSMTYVTDLTAAYDRDSRSNARNTPRVAQTPSLGSVAGSRPGKVLPILGRTPSGRFMSPTFSNLANLDAGDYDRRPPIPSGSTSRDNLPPPSYAKPVARAAGRVKVRSNDATPEDLLYTSLYKPTVGPSHSLIPSRNTARDNPPRPGYYAKPVAQSAGRVKVRSNDATPEDLLYISLPGPTPDTTRSLIPSRNIARDNTPRPSYYTKPVTQSAGRIKVRSNDSILGSSVSPSLLKVAACPASHVTAISEPSAPKGIELPSPRRTFTIHNPETPTSSHGPRAVNNPARVVSRATSSQSLTTSADKTTTTKTGNTKSLAALAFHRSQEAVVFNEYEELAMQRPKTPDPRASPGREETREFSRSPPLLLSVIASEHNFDPNAPPPGLYTVPEILNLVIEKNIEFTKDGDPKPVNVGDWKVEIAGVEGRNVKLPESSSKVLSNKMLIDTAMGFVKDARAKATAAKEVQSCAKQQNLIFVHPNGKPYSAAQKILVLKKARDEAERAKGPSGRKKLHVQGLNVNIDDTPMSNKILTDTAMEFVKDTRAKEIAAREERSCAKQQNLSFVHPDGKPYSAAQKILALKKAKDEAERAKGPSGRKKLLVQGLNVNLDGTPMSDEQTEALWDEMEREKKANGGKFGNPSSANYDWANEDRQTPVLGEDTIKAVNKRRMKIPEHQAALARIKADSDKTWDKAVEDLKKAVKRIRATRATAAAKAALMNPTHDFLDMPVNIMDCIMRELLVVAPDEEVVPYHYVAGKVIKNADGGRWGLRTKPQVNILVALCATQHQKVRLALDTGRNVLYRENQFAFRKPAELILFVNTIGWINIARMDFDKNLVVSINFVTKYTHSLEVKWLALWQTELKSTMQGRELITPDWKPEDFNQEYQPREIEKALSTMVEVLKESKDMGTPRIRTLDLGDDFSSIVNMLQDMGMDDTLQVGGKAKAETEEGTYPQIDWNDWVLDRASGEEDYFVSFYRAENGDARSQSGAFLDDQGDLYDVSDREEVDDEEEGEGDEEDDEEDETSIASENDTLDREIKELIAAASAA